MFSVTRPHNKVGIFGQESRKKCSKNIDKKGGKKKKLNTMNICSILIYVKRCNFGLLASGGAFD